MHSPSPPILKGAAPVREPRAGDGPAPAGKRTGSGERVWRTGLANMAGAVAISRRGRDDGPLTEAGWTPCGGGSRACLCARWWASGAPRSRELVAPRDRVQAPCRGLGPGLANVAGTVAISRQYREEGARLMRAVNGIRGFANRARRALVGVRWACCLALRYLFAQTWGGQAVAWCQTRGLTCSALVWARRSQGSETLQAQNPHRWDAGLEEPAGAVAISGQ